MADTNVGKVTQIVGAVIDAKFTEGKLPEIHDAITRILLPFSSDCFNNSSKLNSDILS